MSENELDCSNEDEEYMEPNRNDSDHGLENASFDPHIDSILMDNDSTRPPPHKVEFFDLTKKVHREHESEWFMGIKITLFKPPPQ